MAERRALVFIDGWCDRCRAAGRALERLDRRRRIDVVSFREDTRYRDFGLALEDLESRMYVVDAATRRTYGGYRAVQALARLLPPLWALRPLLALAQWTGQGARLYDYLARRRRIVPDPRACGEVRPPGA